MSSHGFSDEDLDAIERRKNGDKPRPKGKIPYLPDRTATLPELREWASNAAGLPPEVRVETITRPGRDPSDPLSIYLSNGVELRCEHQKQLQMPRTLQAFLASESDGIAQPSYLSPAEVGDFYIALCRLGTAAARTNARSALSEQLAAFVELTAEVPGSIVDRARRYDMLQTLRARPTFDRAVALAMRNGVPEVRPALVVDPADETRYIRASEWVIYLRFVVGQTVDERGLPARMAEIDSERIDLQAWNVDRSHKAHLILYLLPEGV